MPTEETISIEGTLLMLDDTSPHVAVVVQAIRDGEVVATTLSNENGKYQFVNLRPGHYQLRCYTIDGYLYYGKDRPVDSSHAASLKVQSGKILENMDFHFAPFKKGTWRTYTYLDGLAGNYVRSFYCDPDGVMWFGSGGGVSRYDGKEFVSLTMKDGLAAGLVSSIHRDPDGVMWFGTTASGVSRFDGREFINFTTEDGLAGNDVYDIYRDPDGALWFAASDGGVSRYDGKEFVNLTTEDGLASNTVRCIHQDPDGIMWFGTGGGVSRYDGKEFVNLTTEDGLVDNSVWCIYRDPDGVLWFSMGNLALPGGGVSRYDARGMGDFAANSSRGMGDSPHFVNFTTEDGLAYNTVYGIHRDPDGVMWFGTAEWDGDGGGLSRYDGKGFINFTREDGLASNRVNWIYRDPDGVLWVCTWGAGFSRYDPQAFVNFTTKDGLVDNHVNAIYRDPDGAMWFGTQGGVSRYDARGMGDFPHFVNLTTKDGLVDNVVSAIDRDTNGVMWFGTSGGMGRAGGGVSRYDGKEFINFTKENGLVDNFVNDIHCDPDGVVWFATGGWAGPGGVSRYDARGMGDFAANSSRGMGDFPHFVNFTTKDGLADNYVNAIYCDTDGVMWFGTWPGWHWKEGGVSRYDGSGFVNFSTEDGLVDNTVHAIHRDQDGALWFGTNGGVSRYDGKEFVNFTTEEGLVANVVNAVYCDTDGVMWFGTSGGGVSGYDGEAWTSLDTRDGLAGNNVRSILQDPDGFLWFGTEGGITRYRRSATPPKARIVSVTTDQTYRDLSAIPTFTPGTRVTIEYSSIDFKTIPEKRQYRCRIYETRDVRRETSDSEFQMSGSGLESQVSGLKSDVPYNPPTKQTNFDWIPEKPGTYIFEVQAIDRDLNYSEPATLSLNVEPDPLLLSLQTEVNHLRREVGQKYHFDDIIGRSTAVSQVRALMERAIDSGLTVLIAGETGTGKELVAKAIHYNSPRKSHPLLDRNCGAIPRELLAGDLFGYRKGAFTGADEDRIGLFEAASGGTVLLDEISEMPHDAQIHLLRVLEERKVQRLGENTSRDVDVRIIAMTNRDLIEEGKAGRFREDLYYRLSEFCIPIPPLRERKDDIPLLAEHFLQEYSQDHKKEMVGFAPGLFEMLQSYSWPGNVRELRNAVRRAAALAEEGELIYIHHFPPQIVHEILPAQEIMQAIEKNSTRYRDLLDRFERGCIEHALRACKGNRSQAAKMLGLGRKSLYEKMQRLGIDTQ